MFIYFVFLSSGMHKPPLAPKPKLVQKPGLSPSTTRRDGLSLPSPGTQRKVKPVLAPKPCLSKLTAAVESKPLASKSLHPTSVTESPRAVGLLNSQNGIQQENKKPDWDYIIPICLCSQENCQCIRNTPPGRHRVEKELNTLHNGRTEVNRNILLTSRCAVESGERTAHSHVISDTLAQNANLHPASTITHLTHHKPLQEMHNVDKNPNTDISTSRPAVNVRPSLPHRTWSDEANGNVIPQSPPGQGPKEVALGSEQTSCVPGPKPVPAAAVKPVPVPRKPRAAALAVQEKVEGDREEGMSQEGREFNVREVNVSSAGKDSASLSVSVPVNENRQPVVLSVRKACAPPAPPPKKKPFLSAPEKVSFETLPKDVDEEDLGWDGSIYEMEISVDKEDEEVEKEMEGKEDQEAVYSDLTRCPPCSSSLQQLEIRQPPAVTAAAEKVPPSKPQRHKNPKACIQRKESSEVKEKGTLADNEKRRVLPRQDCVLMETAMRELPLPPGEKASRNLLAAGIVKPSRSSLGKQKAKSFSVADLVCSDRSRRNSFRKLLDLKLSVKMLPKLIAKGGQSQDCTANDNEQSVDNHQDASQNLPEHLGSERKFSWPLIGVEQSVDGDEDVLYENIRHYEEIPDYEEVLVGEAASSPRASFAPPTAWHSQMYDDGIYEEPEPYVSFEKNSGNQQCQKPTQNER